MISILLWTDFKIDIEIKINIEIIQQIKYWNCIILMYRILKHLLNLFVIHPVPPVLGLTLAEPDGLVR